MIEKKIPALPPGVNIEELQAKPFATFLAEADGDEDLAAKRFGHYEAGRSKKMFLIQEHMTSIRDQRSGRNEQQHPTSGASQTSGGERVHRNAVRDASAAWR